LRKRQTVYTGAKVELTMPKPRNTTVYNHRITPKGGISSGDCRPRGLGDSVIGHEIDSLQCTEDTYTINNDITRS